jgi:hypothetical protein
VNATRLAVAPTGHSPADAECPFGATAKRWTFALAALLAGCCTCPPPAPPHAYVGPTDSIDVVVARINRNAVRVPTLWSQLDYTASFVDPERKQTTAASGDGVLLYARPDSIRISGNKDIAGEVFQLGCDGDQFWVKVRRSVSTGDYYWGHLANVGRPGCQPVPIRPDLISQVLGVGLLQTNLLALPTPVMRFDNDADAYVFDFNVRRPDRWVTQKEVWYDRATDHPTRVLLYDDAGRVVLRADLSQHQPVDAPDDVPVDRRPIVARHYDLRFPDTGSTMSLDLNDPEVTHKVGRVTLPNAATFRRTPPDEHDTVTQVDAACANAPRQMLE